MKIYASLARALKLVMLSQLSVKITIEFIVAKTEQYTEHKILWFRTIFMIDFVRWLTTTS